ncbi:MAG TPA: PH domain-containing protein [Propionibacteriaceae bacterium]|nr:PH domain-containing protein [Propionibacteriaceae bacterium]
MNARAMSDALFSPPDEAWVPLSPQYLRLKRLMVLVNWTWLSAIPVVALGVLWRWDAAAGLAALAVCWIGYRWWRQKRAWLARGYAERDNDLFIKSGLLMRQLTIVPYGRMQVVEVASGPLERRFGLAHVQLVTASSSTDATIPGLTEDAATALRERLAERGEHQAAGL